MGISRSAISKHMAELEARLGLKLCRRGRGGFELTDHGREVYEGAEQALRSLDEFRNRIDRLHTELVGSLHLAVVDSTLHDPANPIIGAMRRLLIQSPAVEITLSIMSSSVMEAALLDDRIHIGVLPRRPAFREQLVYKPLYSETSGLYCGRAHPLFTHVSIECDDLVHQRYISPSFTESGRLVEVLGSAATQVRTSAIARNVEGTAMLLLTGQLLGFLPAHVSHPLEASGAIRSIRPDYFTVQTPMDVIFKARKEMNPVLERFLQELKIDSR